MVHAEDDACREIAKELEQQHPWWIVIFGTFTRGPDALGVFQRRAHPPGRHHQGRAAAGPRRADRGGLVLPAPARDRGHAAASAGRLPAGDAGPLVEGQQRLHATYAKLTRRGKIPSVAVTATARELAGFVWAEMTS